MKPMLLLKTFNSLCETISVKPEGLDPSGVEDDSVEAGDTVTLQLIVGRIKPLAAYYWLVNGEQQDGTLAATEENGDGTYKQTATFSHTFSKNPAEVEFRYLIEIGVDGEDDVDQLYKTVQVYCEYDVLFDFQYD